MEISNERRLEVLAQEAMGCQRCELAATRSQVVFSSGGPNSSLVVVGEAPGASEDKDGVPFIGRSGQLLTRLISEEIGLDRTRYYITNVVKCRPPENRRPSAGEISACSYLLAGQLEVVDKKVVLAVGEVAARSLTGLKSSVGSMRGQIHTVDEAKIVVTYHPAYALRGGSRVTEAMRSDLMIVGGLLDGK
ncbi:MAG: uracil-DNA glycosylase [Actinomycetota bacterium]|nr:uracil-DNA glycosylase [Actinomycetota bacterium]